MKPIAVLDAPTNLGLRPPVPGAVPGCAKAPGALRDLGLLRRLAARDAGCLTPPRYDRGDWQEGDGDFHVEQITAYSKALAARIERLHGAGEFPLVLGGDCTVMFAAGHWLSGRPGRFGLAYLDGHSDFRHAGNTDVTGPVGAAAGEGMAICTGRGQPGLSERWFADEDIVVLGIRDADEGIAELDGAGIAYRTVPVIRDDPAGAAAWTLERLQPAEAFWLHLDVDILDPEVMPAVDGPDPDGLQVDELTALLRVLAAAPGCLGMNVSIYDPDLDPTGEHAATIVEVVAGALTG